jgi:hypothetical protein
MYSYIMAERGPRDRCPKCNGRWIRNNQPSAIVQAKIEGDSKGIIIGNFIPVRAFVCEDCGFVELYHIKTEG